MNVFKKLYLSIWISIIMIPCITSINVFASNQFIPYSQQKTNKSSGITYMDIINNARTMYNLKWTPMRDLKSFVDCDTGKYTYFVVGNDYTLPYGQPYSYGYYIGYDIVNDMNVDYLPVYSTCVTLSSFLAATKDVCSPFYNQVGYGDTEGTEYKMTCPYYALDCSSFVSLCWELSKRYTTREFAYGGEGSRSSDRPVCVYDIGTLEDIAYDNGYSYYDDNYLSAIISTNEIISYINYRTGCYDIDLQGYALCKPGSHIVLISDRSVGGVFYNIEEETPPQLKVSCLSLNEIFSKYKDYHLYRLIYMEDHVER